ncbi:sugar O-acyltransferase, sialic acid O-acetyltransferase NeuD family [Nocardioides sp. YR527]|uniref:NeuD/PglB/VioB family sugar acetyltransferase n=1 Tax=Nocardioides sp. YR527 TaxID=1881028 RepID=UPI00087F7EFA|nr:NeuD/PglB/VioB family sugar acetyltransferase [Nocardioides sp. YR527]SDK96785.1 sugar O-acyltransferase, sialic acid O-acetyltransferase NeuD family [Nocardioides sp. YR527]
MTTLVLVAASGLAGEVAAATTGYDQIVAVDDDRERWGTIVGGVEVIGPVELVSDSGTDLVVCAGSGRIRRRLIGRLLDYGVTPERFATVIHPDASVAHGCEVGRGSILLAGARLTSQVSVGRHVVVMPNAVLTHDDMVGDFATLCAGVALGGEVVVGEAAYLGMNSSVRQRVAVGVDAVLGMGAVLLADLPPGETWAGVPARPVRVPV